MPKSADMMLLVIGAVLLVAGLFGGGTKIFSVEIPSGFGGRIARISAMALGLMLIGGGLYLALIQPSPRALKANGSSPQSNTTDIGTMPGQSSKSFCEAIKAQWETKHSWSTQDDEVLRQSFRSHGCAGHGITLP